MSTPLTAPVPFVAGLSAHGDRAALVGSSGTTTYAELADRVEAMRSALGSVRRLVLVAGGNDEATVVSYLGALAGGHPVLLVPPDTDAHVDALLAHYDPDVVVRDGRLTERRTGTTHDLHPDLALLLSTSGSTGSPKLVRLSAQNLQSNAAAIALFLGIRAEDRAVTSLPLPYSYGLSVLNSHLHTGAAVVLTGASVSEPAFWDLVRRQRVSSIAGVPYTFELLERVGFDGMDLPHLRYLTQAGGRMDPARVVRFAELGQRRGFDLWVMYGQTEATARIAYLPPALTLSHPQAVGGAIPGSRIDLVQVPEAEPGTGELVVTGPGVMLGYAERPADLSLGCTVDRLHTGDLARRLPADVPGGSVYELVGRRARFLKAFGLRIDLEQVERGLHRDGIEAWCVDVEGTLAVAVVAPVDAGRVRRRTAALAGLPAHAVQVLALPELPRTRSGKPDLAAVRAHAAGVAPQSHAETDLCRLYADLLDCPDVTPADCFVDLGGDSLSYVEMSLRLETAIGALPADWPRRTIAQLARTHPRPPVRERRLRLPTSRVETSVLLRAMAILMVVSTHTGLFFFLGGAHTMLALAGFNFGRFQVTEAPRRQRTRRMLSSIRRVAVPSIAWIIVIFLLVEKYELKNVLLLNAVLAPDSEGPDWHFWFVEALLAIVLVCVALLCVPALDAWERRWPFAFPMALVAIGMVTRFELLVLPTGRPKLSAVVIFWIFMLGWAAAKATDTRRKLLVSVAAMLTVPGFFDLPQREAVVVTGLLLLLWVPTLPCPRWLSRAAGVLAAGSLHIYLVHWAVFPHLQPWSAALAVVASVAAGLAYWQLVERVSDRRWRGRVRARLHQASSGRSAAA